MADYRQGFYTAKGGDDQLRKRYEQLIQWSAEDGVLDQARKATIPNKLGGAFARLTEFWRREEYAMAGVWEVLSGDAPDQSAGGRWVREMLGGTKLGNLIGVEDERAKKTFEDILTQKGVPEGAKLSDAIGEDWKVIKYFDPSMRDVAGLALSVFATPSTYLTAGAGGATKIAGRAGAVVRVNKRGMEYVDKMYRSRLEALSKGLNISDDVKKMPLAQLQKEVVQGEAARKAMYDVNTEFGQKLLQREQARILADIDEDAVRRAATRIAGARRRGEMLDGVRASEMTDSIALRFMGAKLPGSDKVISQARDMGAAVLGAAREGRLYTGGAMGRFLAEGGVKFASMMDKAFQRIPFGARKHESFRKIEMRRHASRQSAEQQASELLFGKGGVMTKRLADKLKNDEKASKAFAKFVDANDGGVAAIPMKPKAPNPKFAEYRQQWLEQANRLGLDEQEALAVADRWVQLANHLGANAAMTGLLAPQTVMRYWGRYFPHQVKEGVFDAPTLKRARLSPTHGDIGEYGLKRDYDTFDDFIGAVRNAAAKSTDTTKKMVDESAEAAVDWNVPRVLHDYVTRHMRAEADVRAVTDTVAMLGVDLPSATRGMLRGLYESFEGLSDAELGQAQKALDAMFNQENLAKALEGATSKTKAAFLYEGAQRNGTLTGLDKFIKANEDLIGEVGPQHFAEIRKAAGRREFTVSGQDFAEYTFKEGPNKGQRHIVPKGVRDFWDSDMTALKTRMPEEVSTVIKYYDLLQNTFKRAHTIIFPSFHARNAYSNIAAMAVETNIANQMSPSHVRQVISLMANTADDFTIKASNGRTYTKQQLRNLMIDLDLIPDRMRVDELTGNVGTFADKIEILRKADDFIGRKSQGIENYARASYFLSQIKRGVSTQDAALNVKKVLFDYSDLSFTQREVIRRLFPFATWTMKNVELQARNMLARPGRVAAVAKVMNAGERGPEADLLPEFRRGEMKIGLKPQPGQRGLFLTGIDLPINSVDQIWAGGVGATLRENFAMFTPVMKGILEYTLAERVQVEGVF